AGEPDGGAARRARRAGRRAGRRRDAADGRRLPGLRGGGRHAAAGDRRDGRAARARPGRHRPHHPSHLRREPPLPRLQHITARLLLLLPTTTYRGTAFVEAARQVGVELTVASEEPSTLQAVSLGALITLPLQDPHRAAAEALAFARSHPIAAVVGVDDDTAIVAATIAERLGLKGNPPPAARAARDKHLQRELLAKAGVPIPRFTLRKLAEDPAAIARTITFPCVLKPLNLSASRGVIRADDAKGFTAAHSRLKAIVCEPDAGFLIEEFIPGYEVALEGLVANRRLHVLAIFDKPDPLDGPFFEETIYLTPSTVPAALQKAIVECAERAVRALGITEGPIHAELRYNERGPWLIELAARPIGGRCSAVLRFGEKGI